MDAMTDKAHFLIPATCNPLLDGTCSTLPLPDLMAQADVVRKKWALK